MSVYNRIRIEILWVYGLPFWHVSLMVPLIFGRRTWRTEDNGRLENEFRDISVQSLFLNALAYWPFNKIGRGQPRRRLDNTLLFCRRPIKLSMCLAWGTWCACIHLVIIVAICSAAVQQCSNAMSQMSNQCLSLPISNLLLLIWAVIPPGAEMFLRHRITDYYKHLSHSEGLAKITLDKGQWMPPIF